MFWNSSISQTQTSNKKKQKVLGLTTAGQNNVYTHLCSDKEKCQSFQRNLVMQIISTQFGHASLGKNLFSILLYSFGETTEKYIVEFQICPKSTIWGTSIYGRNRRKQKIAVTATCLCDMIQQKWYKSKKHNATIGWILSHLSVHLTKVINNQVRIWTSKFSSWIRK